MSHCVFIVSRCTKKNTRVHLGRRFRSGDFLSSEEVFRASWGCTPEEGVFPIARRLARKKKERKKTRTRKNEENASKKIKVSGPVGLWYAFPVYSIRQVTPPPGGVHDACGCFFLVTLPYDARDNMGSSIHNWGLLCVVIYQFLKWVVLLN